VVKNRLIPCLALLVIIVSMNTLIINMGVVEGQDTVSIDNGFIKIIWDLANGGAIRNILATCKDFTGTSVASRGINSIRAGGGLSIETLMFDIISNNNPWYGKAIGTHADYRVLEETDQYTLIEISYVLGDPFPGLKVVKTYRVYKQSFIIDFNMTLINTGTSQITIDMSNTWNRPSGPMLEIASLMGDKRDEQRFVMYKNGTVDVATISSLGFGPALKVGGELVGLGVFDKSLSVSPWGFMYALFMADEETIGKTAYVWPEHDPGGSPSTVIRIEFSNVTLNPGDKEEYHMKIYAGPIHYEYLKETGISRDVFDKNFYSPDFSPKIPCKIVQITLNYSINMNIVSEAGAGIPKTTIILLDPITGDVYNQFEINSTSFRFGMPFNNTFYTLKIDPISGLTRDGLGEYRFTGWELPNGTVIQSPEINLTLVDGATVKLRFRIIELARIQLLFVTPDNLFLPSQAGDINVSILSSIGQLVFSATSTTNTRNITVMDQTAIPSKPGLSLGSYVIRVPYTAGVYSLEKIMLNNKEISFERVGDYAQATIILDKGGKYDLKIIYSSSGAMGGLLIWIAIVVVLVAFVIIALVLKKGKKPS